jgi:hypothetical protein
MKIIQTKFTNIYQGVEWYEELTQQQYLTELEKVNTCKVDYYIEKIKERDL